MCACADIFKFQIKGSENVSIETWIRDAKFNLKIPILSEDINKMQTVFPRSGIFPRSRIHNNLKHRILRN